MPSLSGSKNPIRETVKGLCTFLLANVAALEEARDEWPSYNQKLALPCVSVFAKEPKRMAVYPYVIDRSDASGPDDDRTADITRVVGQYDLTLQLDLWCAYKPQRDSLFADISSAFNLDPDVHGINYQLTNYFNEYVHYSMDGIKFIDAEEAAQRNEWRVLITVLVSVREIKEGSGRIVETIENTLDIPLSIEATPPDDVGSII